ncbi:MAG: FAD-dependent monooxygenase [Fibrella sp.]|nr:FAD-dependent monooxygenase [Armatimonadota bacterium]
MERLTLPSETEVAIVGGGPVGLLLGCLLTLRGVDCMILERRTLPTPESRAFGIHPPALKVLRTAGVAGELIRRGVKIAGGQVFVDKTRLGRMSLDATDPTFPFVLSVPQTVTESVLERRLYELAPGALVRGADVTAAEDKDGGTYLTIKTVSGGRRARLRARYVVACDGKHSTLRENANIAFRGGKYPDCYLMGDFADNTPFGTDAALFVTGGGIVESFPLPGGLRRWVVRLPERMETRDANDLAAMVRERTGFVVPVETCLWMSPFGIEYRLAECFHRKNLFLAGDAAHIVSPIGGQGMNLGFLDAGELATTILFLLNPSEFLVRGKWQPIPSSYQYEESRKNAAKTALRRAEWNTHLGHPCPVWHPHRALIWGIVNIPKLRRHFAGAFTMQGLDGK